MTSAWFRWVLSIGFPVLLAACGTSSNAPRAGENTSSTGGAIPIGVAVAQTSNVALLGQEQVAGAKLAEKYFNEIGRAHV